MGIEVAFRRSLERYLLIAEASLKCVGLRCQTSTLDPCVFFVFCAEGSAAGVFATHIDDILGRGAPDVLTEMRIFPGKRFGELKLQDSPFVREGMELAHGHTFPATLTQSDFAKNLQPIPVAPKLRAARQKLLPPEDGHLCRRKLGELRWLAMVSRPDIRPRLARVASRINLLQGSDVYRMNGLIKTAKTWQRAAALKYVSPSLQGTAGDSTQGEKLRQRKRKIHSGATTLVGWSDAASGDQ